MNRFEAWVVEQLEDPEKRQRWLMVAYAASVFMLTLGVIVIVLDLFG